MAGGIHARTMSYSILRVRHALYCEQLESRRLLSAGQLDPTFGNNGFAQSELFPGGTAYAVALQADGKVIAGGTGFDLARFNSDGNVDRTFGVGGRAVAKVDGNINALAVQKDGKIVAAGFEGKDFALARYLPNGKLDASFGSHGIATVAFSRGAAIKAVAIQSDGKIDVAGYALNTLGELRIALARFTTAGKLDVTFGSNGIVATTFAHGGYANALVVQPNGDLLVAGASGSDNTFGDGTFTLARYDSHGKLDPSFGFHGVEVAGDIFDGEITSLALQPNGQIIAGGEAFNQTPAIVRFQRNGTIDHSFGQDGIASPTFDNIDLQVSTVLIQTGGDIVAVGTETQFDRFDTETTFGLVRLKPNGIVDDNYGTQGLVQDDIPGQGNALAAVQQPNGRIIVVGESVPGDRGSDFALARYTFSGHVDNSFGVAGITQKPNGISSINATIVQGDGKIIVAGEEVGIGSDEAVLARYNPDGSLDTTFGVDGRFFAHIGSDGVFNALTLDAKGNIVAGGFGRNAADVGVFAVVRVRPDGTADPSFGTGGAVLTSFGDSTQELFSIAVQTNGDIVAAGSTSGALAVARYLPDGTLDATFATKGKFLFSDHNTFAYATAMALQHDGKILIAGGFDYQYGILRLLPSGRIDSSFGSGGLEISKLNFADAMLLDAAGNIVLGGSVEFDDGMQNAYALARYSPNGKPDPTFGSGAEVVLRLPGIGGGVTSLALQKDGKIVAGGSSAALDSDPTFPPNLIPTDSAVLRFTAKGALDSTFGKHGIALASDGAELGEVSAVIVEPNGDILGSASDLFKLTGR